MDNFQVVESGSLPAVLSNRTPGFVDRATGRLRVDANLPGAFAITSSGYSAVVSIARPNNATPYGAGDAIGIADPVTPANAGSAILEFANIGPAGGHIMLTDIRLEVDVAAVPAGMTGFHLALYSSAPDAILDNAVWDLASAGDRGKFLGFLTIGTPVDLGSTLFVEESQKNKKVKLTGTSIFGVLTTDGAYTPSANTVKKITLQAVAL